MKFEPIKSKKQAWWIYYNKAVTPLKHWENEPLNSGLLLSECPICHTRQTRETYVRGFSTNFFTLRQDLSVTAIAQCNTCGQWLQINA